MCTSVVKMFICGLCAMNMFMPECLCGDQVHVLVFAR